ncbi:MAG TPA: WecB/TagA/CpsF family glycosyltransferase [Candidatus Dormibacteraeota bacterium]
MHERVNVLGVGVSAINMRLALDQLHDWIVSGDRQFVSVCNVHSVMECRRDPRLRQIVNAAGMVTPDGMPLVWLARRSGHKAVARVYGPDLMLAELSASQQSGHSHFFYGGRPGVADRLAAAMRRRFPGARVVGTYSPPLASAAELCNAEVASLINESRADIVWVGISSPKQEYWMSCMRPMLQAAVLIGVGAAFDFHTGNVPQAPGWMQRAGLEWLFRLIVEPRRLWRRYLIDNPWFIFEIARQRLGLRHYEL